MTEFTATEKRDEAKREVRYRKRVFARLVDEGKMDQAQADKRIAVMEAIAADYATIAEAEEAKGRLL